MPPGRAGSLESLRRLNRLRVIRALRDEGQISRAEIARRTGLSRSTVSSLIADLQSDGLVVRAYHRARIAAAGETGLAEDTFPAVCPYSWGDIISRPIPWPTSDVSG